MTEIDIDRFWKIGITFLHRNGYIKDTDFINTWESVYPDYEGDDEYINSMNAKIYEIMLYKDELTPYLTEIVSFIRSNQQPECKSKFKSLWFYLVCDMEFDGLINTNEQLKWFTGIDFYSNNWSDKELSLIQDARTRLRMKLVNCNPSMVEYIEEPNFDVLMTANGIDL